ncbi:MAG: dihydroorotase [Verrucomicrobia bacterium]|nr:dihydroorotase [Verrucomicrobiota bacterium]
MESLLLKGGRVIDPGNRLDAVADVLILDGLIAAVGKDAGAKAPADIRVVQVDGLVVTPGLVDMHVHLREPGFTSKENIATGTAAAARGGFTSVLCMPNTEPVIDNSSTVALIREAAALEAKANVFIAGAISKGLDGEMLAPASSLKSAGVVALTDDGHCIQNNELMRRAMEYSAMFELPVLDHCQDAALASEGVMHEGYWSTALGLQGYPSVAEEMIVARNILLSEMTGVHVHCQHISVAGSVQLLREAKLRGVRVSGEAAPHHFVLTDAAVAGSDEFWAEDGLDYWRMFEGKSEKPSWPVYETNLKMNPPLRSNTDREVVINAVRDGTLDVIASDHAPHGNFEKEVEFDYAPFGITGLETELALALTTFYHTGRMGLMELIRRFTAGPSEVLRIDKGVLNTGGDGDLTIIDPDREWVFERSGTQSRSMNSPFYGWPMKGRAVATIISGGIAWNDPGFVL